jgi:GNAT superfamily N-acetyltransferase
MPDDDALDIRPATADRWPELATLFERPGLRGGRQSPSNCWCSVWRQPMRAPEENRDALRARVEAGEEPGLLAVADGEPVGWVSVGPREDFPVLCRSRDFGPLVAEEDVWVVTCFHVDPRHRRRGVAAALLAAAVAHATAGGAQAIEAFPADPPDYKGRAAWFREAGFAPTRTSGKRTVMRLEPAASG